MGHHLAVTLPAWRRGPRQWPGSWAVSPLHGAVVPPLHGVARAAQPFQRLDRL